VFTYRTVIDKFCSKQESECKFSNSIWMLNILISITKIAKVKILVSHNVDAVVLTDSIFCRCFHRAEKFEAAKFSIRRWKLK